MSAVREGCRIAKHILEMPYRDSMDIGTPGMQKGRPTSVGRPFAGLITGPWLAYRRDQRHAGRRSIRRTRRTMHPQAIHTPDHYRQVGLDMRGQVVPLVSALQPGQV
jgi:hypothetical protein